MLERNIGSFSFSVTVVLLFLVSLFILALSFTNPMLSLAILFLLISFIPLIYHGIKGNTLENPIVLIGLSFFLFGGVSSVGVFMIGVSRYPSYTISIVFSIASLCLTYLVYYFSGKLCLSFAKCLPTFEGRWKTSWLVSMIFLLFFIGFYALKVRLDVIGVNVLHTNSNTLPAALQTDKLLDANWTIPLLSAPAVGIMVWYIFSMRSNWFHLLLWISVVVFYFITFSALGSRSRLVMVLVPVLFVHHFMIKKLKTSYIVVILISIWLAYIVFGQKRSTIEYGYYETAQKMASSYFLVSYLTDHDDLMEFRATLDVVDHYPDKEDFLLGSTILTPITNWVPRRIWPNKPDSASVKYTSKFRPLAWSKGGTAPPGYIGEWYMNFGFPGIVIGMIFLGVAVRVLKEYRDLNSNNSGVNMIYAASSLPVAMIARGCVGYVLTTAETNLFFLIVILVFARTRKQETA